ncbi:MAG: 16S rRNA (guanine(527)-N(7))-methyltransferase RsmG [Deltaproteobacteria bacterium]|nr:MAG: 16S rRNA (guanine(527)-N(7))-methyltransferase RsmG [Deltaproteobacteria bacterium]
MTDLPHIVKTYESFLAQYSVRLNANQCHLIDLFLRELTQWNKTLNLTGLRSAHQITRHLLLDSLICAAKLPERARVLDVGSGAGFPAIPIKIYHPEVETQLLEPNRKRANFLKHLRRVLGLTGFQVSRQRLEEHEKDNRGAYEVITARAVMSPLALVALCSHLLRREGFLVIFLGEKKARLHATLMEKASSEGLILRQLLRYTLPGLQTNRHLAFFQKHD